MTNQITNDHAKLLYETYCSAVGGVAFNGDPLPNWEEFSADPAKEKQVVGWLAAARTSLDSLYKRHSKL